MALFVGLDVSLKTVSICIVKADGSVVWEGKAFSEPASLIKALARRRKNIQLVGIEACPLSEWLYGALVDSGFTTVCIETRHAQRFLSSRPNKTDRSDARGIADMMRLGHYRPVHAQRSGERGRPGRRNGFLGRTKKRDEEESEEMALDGTDRITETTATRTGGDAGFRPERLRRAADSAAR